MNLPFNLKSSDRAERVSEPAGRAICQHHRILLAAKSREALSPIPCPATRNQATLRPFPKTHSCMGLSPPIHYAFWLVNQDLTSLNLQVANSTREKFAVDLAPDLRAGDLSSAFFSVLLKKLRFFWRRGSISGSGGRGQSGSADSLPRTHARVARGGGRSALRLDKGKWTSQPT